MKFITKKLIACSVLSINFFLFSFSYGDNHNFYETIVQLQKDIKTLEKAVYSGSIELDNKSIDNSNTSSVDNSEDVLTRHLLKLSEIENQFQQLTNKFEEINFNI